MLNSFGISFSSFDGDAHREKYIHDEPMAGSYSRRQLLSAFRQKDTTIGAGRCHSFPLQPGDGFNGGDMGNAEAAGNICRTRLARAGQQVSDELNIVLKQSCRLGRTSLAEAARLGQLRGKLCRRFDSFSHCSSGTSRLLGIAAMASLNLTMR